MVCFVVPDLSDPEVVCQQPCDHPRCAKLRKFATRRCFVCGKGFEAGQRFYFDIEGKEAVHQACWDG